MVKLVLVAADLALLVKDGRLEHGAVLVDGADGLAAHDLGAVELRQLDLLADRRDVARAGIDRDGARAVAKRRARDVHGHVARADHRHALAHGKARGVHQVVDAVQHVSARLAGNAQLAGSPGARAHKDGVVSVAQQVIDVQGAADGGRGAHANAQLVKHLSVALHQLARQAELGDAVLKHAADLGALLKDGDAAAGLRQLDRRREARRARANHRDLLAAGRRALEDGALKVGGRDVALDGREVNGRALAALNAATLALARVVAHQRANGAHGVVGEQQLARLFKPALTKQPDDLRDRCRDRAALKLAKRTFAAQAAVGFLDDVYGHGKSSPVDAVVLAYRNAGRPRLASGLRRRRRGRRLCRPFGAGHGRVSRSSPWREGPRARPPCPAACCSP